MIPSVQPDVLRTELNRSIYYLVSRERGAPGASRSFDDFRDLRIALAGQLPHLAFPPAGDVADEYAAVARLKLLRSWLETVSAHREGLDVAARHELDQFLMPGPFRMLLPPLGSKAQPMRRSQSWVSIISNSDDDEAAAKPADGWASSLGAIFFGEARFDSPPKQQVQDARGLSAAVRAERRRAGIPADRRERAVRRPLITRIVSLLQCANHTAARRVC